jgi:hypothetical protein
LREPGSLFYPFAALIFVVAPLIGATIAALKAYTNKFFVFLRAAGTVFALSALSFILTYAVYPASQRTSVLLPASCGGFAGAQSPAGFVYNLPGVGPVMLVTSDARSALLAAIDFRNPPFPSTVYLVRKSDNHILWNAHFANDIIAAVGGGEKGCQFGGRKGASCEVTVWPFLLVLRPRYGACFL